MRCTWEAATAVMWQDTRRLPGNRNPHTRGHNGCAGHAQHDACGSRKQTPALPGLRGALKSAQSCRGPLTVVPVSQPSLPWIAFTTQTSINNQYLFNYKGVQIEKQPKYQNKLTNNIIINLT